MSEFERNLIGSQVRLLLIAGGKLRVERGELVSVDVEGLVLRIDGRTLLFYRAWLIGVSANDDDDGGSMTPGDQLLQEMFKDAR